MKAKSAAIQGALALGALALAYTTWQRPPEGAPDSVVVVEATKNDVQKIRYQLPGRAYELTRDTSGSEPTVWLHQMPVKEPEKKSEQADAGAPTVAELPPGHPPTPTAPPVVERTLLGNKGAIELFEKFAPLRGARSLGVVPPEKLKELGLEGAKKKLTVTTRRGERSFDVGELVAGMGQPYLRDTQDNRIYLLQGTVLTELDNAESRLVNRAVHDFQLTDVDAIAVKTAARQRDLVLQHSEGPGPTKYAPKNAPDKPDEFVKNWHDRVWRLAPVEVLGKGEAPAGGEPTIKLRVDYLSKGKPKGFLELGTAANGDAYVRSEHTAGWMKVTGSASELIKEADKVVAGT